jgi:hypothetical protein
MEEKTIQAIQEWIRETFKPVLKEICEEIFSEMVEEVGEKMAEPRYYTRDQVCEKLDICRATFHNWQNKGVFKKVKIGNRIYIDADAFDKYMEEHAGERLKFRIRPQHTK